MRNKINTIYKQAERFAAITNKAILSGNSIRAKKCIDIDERLFESGSAETKNVISNVYVYSVSTYMELKHYNIATFFPKSLKAEYLKQINATSV